MQKILLFTALTVLPIVTHAQIMKCVGADGRVEFSNACPPGMTAAPTGIRSSPGGTSSGAQKSLADRDAEFRKRKMEQETAAKKTAAKDAEAADTQQNCISARSYLRSLQDGQRIANTDPATGERNFLDDAQRASEMERAERAVSSNCQ